MVGSQQFADLGHHSFDLPKTEAPNVNIQIPLPGASVEEVESTLTKPIEEAVKIRILGLHLMNVVGPDVLSAAVEALREQMKAEP